MKKTIVVIDDDVDMREGLHAWLSKQYQVELFADADSFLLYLDALKDCDCLLLDLRMPGMSGTDLQRELSGRHFAAPIVFMSGDAQQSDVIAAWRAGAFDFVLKPFSPDEISDALKKVFLAIEAHDQSSMPESLPITRREAQVLQLLGEGLHQQEIADRLNLALRTVKMYRSFLKNKLHLNTLADIARFCDRYRDIIKKQAL